MRKLNLVSFISVLAAVVSLFTGCAKLEPFVSRNPLQDGVRGKYWRNADLSALPTSTLPYKGEFLEPISASPDVDAQDISFLSFDLAGSTDQIQLAATFYDTGAGVFRGYAREYSAASGWSTFGSGFQAVAQSTAGSASLAYVGIGALPSGLFLSAFTDDQATPELFPVLKSGAWQAQATAVTAGSTLTRSLAQTQGETVVVRFDNAGRAYIVTASGGDSQVLRFVPGSGVINTIMGETGIGAATDAEFDGVQWMCTFTQAAAPPNDTVVGCIDAAAGLATYEPTTIATLSGAQGRAGLDVATNGDGTMMVVFNEFTTTATVQAVLIEDGVAGTAVGLTTGLPTGFQALHYGGNRPQVVALGSGRYMAAWIGYNLSSSRLFYALYDPTTGWGVVQTVTDSARAFSGGCPGIGCPYRSVALFSNGGDNVGIAARGEVSASWRTYVSRYHTDYGWLGVQAYGNGCTYSTAVQVAACSAPARGAILEDGTTVVVFPDQDTSGNSRVASAEFK